MPEWLRRLLQIARGVIPRDFVGQIEVNVFLGGISSVNVRQTYKGDQVGAGNAEDGGSGPSNAQHTPKREAKA